eukprot:2656544-Prymnesium_polylepis.2
MLVATEPIEAGQEVRIDYEAGGSTYWAGCPPPEVPWRHVRVSPPPPCALEDPFCPTSCINELEARDLSAPCAPIRWEGAEGGDVRLQALVPLFSSNGRNANESAWSLVSTHVPGRSGRECRDRWQLLQYAEAHSTWLGSPTTSSVSHLEAAEAMIAANCAAATKAAAQAASSQRDAEGERCCILGCAKQLLKCNGFKDAGCTVGRAQSWHFV